MEKKKKKVKEIFIIKILNDDPFFMFFNKKK